MSKRQVPEVFVYLDGDDVGASIELRLLENDHLEAEAISSRVSNAIARLADALVRDVDARLVFAAGDEVLVTAPAGSSWQVIELLRAEFERQSGLTISCGIGPSPAEATNQLRLAKLSGKNRTRRVGDG